MSEEQFHALERLIHAMIVASVTPMHSTEVYHKAVREQVKEILVDDTP